MNLTRTPETSDPEALSRKFPHIDSEGKTTAKKKKEPSGTKKEQRAKSPVRKKEKKEFATKAERRRVKQADDLALPIGGATPTPAPSSSSKPKSKPKKPAEEEDDEDEGDDLLQVEYPGGPSSKPQNRDFSPAFHSVRKFDDFMDQRESEADDADDESLNESDADFKLPSPVNHPVHEPEGDAMDVDEEEEQEQEDTRDVSDMEDDLEKDLAEAFGQNDGGSSPAARHDHGDESEISEED